MENKTIKVSVIVPVYNVESYLRQCLDSLKNQTLKEIEFILINDCSTDNCGSICEEYAHNDDRFVVIHNEKNIRQGLSRNKGIKHSKGEFLGFVDADDYVDSDFYEKLYNSAIFYNTDIAKTEAVLINEDGSRETQFKQNRKILKGLKNGTPLFMLFSHEHWTAIFNRKKILNNNVLYPDIRNGQDDIFLLRSTYYLNTISVISGSYYFYRKHALSTISVREIPYFESIIEGFRYKIEFLNSHEITKSHYLAYFYLALRIVNIRYSELIKNNKLDEYKTHYIREALSVLLMYKYDHYDLLNNFYFGFGNIIISDNSERKDPTHKVYTFINNIKNTLFNILKK